MDAGSGVTLTLSMGAGVRRDGFEILRDIATAHRRARAAKYLDAALEGSWEEPLRELARQVNLAVAHRGKLPTAKQFAALGAPVANAWFGGDLTALYTAVGEKAAVEQVRVQLMPYDRATFCNRVFAALGGWYIPNSRAAEDYDGNTLSWYFRRVASKAPRFVQLEEALDRPPTEEEFGTARLTWPEGLAFDEYAAIVGKVRAELPTRRAASAPRPEVRKKTEGQPTVMASRRPVPASRPTAPAQSAAARPVTHSTAAPAPAAPGSTPAVPSGQPALEGDSPGHPPVADTADSAQRPGVIGRLFGRRQPAPPSPPPAGWYPDPQLPGQLRWWDGMSWTAHVRPR